MKKLKVTENMIMWAFRYTIDRNTGATYEVVEYLTKNWDNLSEFMQTQIKKEIKDQQKKVEVGMSSHFSRSWNEVLEL